MAMKNTDKYVAKFHQPVGQPGKEDYLAIDVYKGDEFFGTLEIDDEGMEWWANKGTGHHVRIATAAYHTWTSFAECMDKRR